MKSTGAAECGLTFMISPNVSIGYRMYRCEREGKNIGLLENPDLLKYVFFAVWWCDPKSQRFLCWQVRQTARLQKLLTRKNTARPERGVISDSVYQFYCVCVINVS
jgi:hypothetical protein